MHKENRLKCLQKEIKTNRVRLRLHCCNDKGIESRNIFQFPLATFLIKKIFHLTTESGMEFKLTLLYLQYKRNSKLRLPNGQHNENRQNPHSIT